MGKTGRIFYVSKNRGTPKSSILIGFSIINHPFGGTPIFGNTHMKRKSERIVCMNLLGLHELPSGKRSDSWMEYPHVH